MYGLAVGVAHIGNTLPSPVYALLSGLNAATVGIIALAAVRLSERAITDKLTRFLVYLGGAMGMLYTALWYYPAIMAGSALTTLIWDLRWVQRIGGALTRCHRKPVEKEEITRDLEEGPWSCSYRSSQHSQKTLHPPSSVYTKRESISSIATFENPRPAPSPAQSFTEQTESIPTSKEFSTMSWQMGTAIIAFFVISFIATLTIHFVTGLSSRAFSLFSSLYLAGTIIFGGGPVVIPLLREYIVSPGWVSPRDFLLGLAIIQSFPGPNFNFAVYLGALAVVGTSVPSYIGALIAFIAMYAPGMFIVVGFMGLWRLLREKAWFLALLRGINAAAVGLVFTAVYKLWQIGYLTAAVQSGSPLGTDPWLVAITGTAYVGGAWFKMSPPVAILLGGAMGVARYGIFSR